MKKIFTAIAITATVLTIGATGAFAASSCTNANYADADKDGICDNYTVTETVHNSTNHGTETNFVDADNDGVCDNYTTSGGQHHGNGNGRHGHHRA